MTEPHSKKGIKASASKTDVFKSELQREFENGDIIADVIEAHRKSNHYSLASISKDVALKCKGISRSIMIESYQVYLSQGKKMENLPHPNYFVAICRQKADKEKKNNKNRSQTKLNVIPLLGEVI